MPYYSPFHFSKCQLSISPVEDVPDLEKTGESGTSVDSNSNIQTSPLNWVEGLYLNSGSVWQDIKRDFAEVANVAKTEPKNVFEKTSATVCSHLSGVAAAANHLKSEKSIQASKSTTDVGSKG
ncbi:unnamed protein product [Protopolystoma xenopodis]|uniref:Uncharacterized protein n=1 Tax=Protopolystoma xenopodis TaxID=117903 RepID=A0A448X212_9PLAT|nr:unnamed protein product [Protopolystoma xenopodis]